MQRWLEGAGPPWYMEGIAELLGTHRWEAGTLTLGIVPGSNKEVPWWPLVRDVKDEVAAGRGMSLIDIMKYDAHAHRRQAAYAWCWAAAIFLDQHPLSQQAFRDLKLEVQDISLEFSKRFYTRLKDHWQQIAEDWQIFIAECDYGYDVPRAAVARKEVVDLPQAGTSLTVATDRGWQSTGLRLQAGKTYQVAASGQYQITGGAKPWPCEAGGVTIRYASGKPLGMLLAGLSELEGEPPPTTPLASPQGLGLGGELSPDRTAVLYFKINEPASGLGDNVGTLTVAIQEAK